MDPDAPRKKGIRRFWELLWSDGKKYLICNLICVLFFVPCALTVSYGVYAGRMPVTLLAGLLSGIPFLAARYGLFDTILRSLRDEPSDWWPSFRRAIGSAWKLYLPGGMLFGASFAAASFLLYWKFRAQETDGVSQWVMPMLYLLLLFMVFVSVMPQMAVLDESFPRILFNGLLFVFGALPRVLAAALLQLVYWGLVIALFPYTLFLLPLTGFWLADLTGCMLLYPQLDRIYRIEETLRARREEEDRAHLAARFGEEEADRIMQKTEGKGTEAL